jgi:hypothetical protein
MNEKMFSQSMSNRVHRAAIPAQKTEFGCISLSASAISLQADETEKDFLRVESGLRRSVNSREGE